jgi:hypothetical protein
LRDPFGREVVVKICRAHLFMLIGLIELIKLIELTELLSG